MHANSPEHSLQEIIKELKHRGQPISRWAAMSLEEIYLGEDFGTARMKGADDPNLKYRPYALRVIALQKGFFCGLGIILSRSSDNTITYGKRLRLELETLPNVKPPDTAMCNTITRLLLEQRKQTVAALELSTAVRDNSRVVQVLYPRLLRSFICDIFGSLGVNLGELQQREAASAIAIGFLKSIPFTSSEPKILTPEF